MTLTDYVSQVEPAESTLVVANRRRTTQPMVELVAGMFDDRPVEVRVEDIADVPSDQMLVLQDGSTVASSGIDEFLDSVIFTDGDRSADPGRSLRQADLPDVLAALEDTTFVLDGSAPAAARRRLFIAISRYIEGLAFETSAGRLRTGFQRLSRMRDERGTAAVYRTLGDTDLDVHVFGVPDWTPPSEFTLTVHAGTTPEYRENWFVVYEPPAELDETGMAFLSTQHTSQEWQGFWTTSQDTISKLGHYISTQL